MMSGYNLSFYFSQVVSVVKRYPDLQKISFIGHSLGGLIARYAIAKLYSEDFKKPTSQDNGEPDRFEKPFRDEKTEGKIAGLEPVNFITSATPHLGLRGHKQVLIDTLHGYLFIFTIWGVIIL